MNITKEQILSALSHVEDPDLGKDLVTLNMISDINVDGNHVQFKVTLTTPACPLKEKIKTDCVDAIHQYIDKEISVEVLMDAKTTSWRKDKSEILPGVKNIIAVGSGKGGVGKSTVAVNLAMSLLKEGAKVGLLDADIYGPSIPIMLGLQNAKPIIKKVNDKNILQPVDARGLKVLSIAFLIKADQPVVWRGPMASSALRQFLSDCDWGELDYLIVDLPPGTGDIQLTLAQAVPMTGVVIVTTPQDVAVADATKAIAMLKMPSINVPVLGVVENMSYFTPAELPNNKYFIFGSGGGKKLAETFKLPFLGEIPLVQAVREGADAGIPVLEKENKMVQQAFNIISGNLARQVAIQNSKPQPKEKAKISA